MIATHIFHHVEGAKTEDSLWAPEAAYCRLRNAAPTLTLWQKELPATVVRTRQRKGYATEPGSGVSSLLPRLYSTRRSIHGEKMSCWVVAHQQGNLILDPRVLEQGHVIHSIELGTIWEKASGILLGPDRDWALAVNVKWPFHQNYCSSWVGMVRSTKSKDLQTPSSLAKHGGVGLESDTPRAGAVPH